MAFFPDLRQKEMALLLNILLSEQRETYELHTTKAELQRMRLAIGLACSICGAMQIAETMELQIHRPRKLQILFVLFFHMFLHVVTTATAICS